MIVLLVGGVGNAPFLSYVYFCRVAWVLLRPGIPAEWIHYCTIPASLFMFVLIILSKIHGPTTLHILHVLYCNSEILTGKGSAAFTPPIVHVAECQALLA